MELIELDSDESERALPPIANIIRGNNDPTRGVVRRCLIRLQSGRSQRADFAICVQRRAMSDVRLWVDAEGTVAVTHSDSELFVIDIATGDVLLLEWFETQILQCDIIANTWVAAMCETLLVYFNVRTHKTMRHALDGATGWEIDDAGVSVVMPDGGLQRFPIGR